MKIFITITISITFLCIATLAVKADKERKVLEDSFYEEVPEFYIAPSNTYSNNPKFRLLCFLNVWYFQGFHDGASALLKEDGSPYLCSDGDPVEGFNKKEEFNYE